MSDDQMRGLKDLLRTETSEPPDVTTPIPRPTGRGRGLSALTETAPSPPATRLAEAPSDPAVVRPARPRPTGAPSLALPSTTTTRSAHGPAPTIGRDLTPRRKTSVTLPPVVRDRVAGAYHHGRWTLLALLELAGERLATGAIGRADIENVVVALADGGGSASIRSLSVPSGLLDQLDELAAAWRLSRSALIAACLMLVLDHLPE